MNVRNHVLLEQELRKMKQRIDQLERALVQREGALIGETEHGDLVYATNAGRRRGDYVSE
jgi:hypothetical protein